MSLPVFWRSTLEADGGLLRLDGPEGRHAAVVRRLRIGERLRVTDGRGAYVEGAVVSVGKTTLEVSVGDRVEEPPPALRLTVVQAVPKADRAALAVEVLAEVGVDRLVPWAAERSQVRLSGQHADRMLRKWRAWAVESSKQARRSWFCEVADVAATADVAALLARADLGVVLHEEAAVRLGSLALPRTGEMVLVVGPEGGIGADELNRLGVAGDEAGISAVRLGDTVLRTSTAGAVAAGVVLAATRWR